MAGWNDCAFYDYDHKNGVWIHNCNNHLQPSDNCRYVERCKICPFYVRQLTLEEVINNGFDY